ncbi:MAG: class I SAM-dependent methyltransferase [Candidatus Omnitrophica bacterium]|nr:class I SAM-dependent methyltransferase [Candidatus Omnitrophota bacterium]MBU4478034.1 class I SAM-dependent methyltransferase [Candidatus Omnitrophota bacterium]MCG2703642.1 class I SAM-dependent methyltransferase [Candidatus Omnitrophota bacterium]
MLQIMNRMLRKSYARLENIFKEALPQKNSLRFLDIGCGYRGNFIYIPPELYTGIDTDKSAINFLSKKGGGRYLVMDARRLSFDDECFDVISSISFFHHLCDAEALLVSRHMRRVLKKNGVAIIADGVYPESAGNVAGWLIRFFDRGRYIRRRKALRDIFQDDFFVDKEYYFVQKVFAYSVLIMIKRGKGDVGKG